MERGKRLGEGTFGKVYAATCSTSGTEYAIKRNITDTTTNFIGSPREADVLHKLKKHPHIIRLEMMCFGSPFKNECFSPLSSDLLKEGRRDDNLHFGFRRAAYDLHSFIYGAVSINFSLMKRYMVQMLLGLEFMHGRKYIHRDIKPSNVLIFAEELDVLGQGNIAQLCDFGLTKPYTNQGGQTPGTITSFWRAPEVALGYPNYDYKCDVWSLGCIFFEMVAKRSFIMVDSDDDNFIISTILGSLPQELPLRKLRDWVKSCKWKDVKLSPIHKPSTRKSWLDQLALTASGKKQFEQEAGSLIQFCDLIDHMICFDCNDRYSATLCLQNPFFNEYKDYIRLTQEKYPPCVKETVTLQIHHCIERRWMAEEVIGIFNDRLAKQAWYSHRKLFQAMDLFDRYLFFMKNSNKAVPNAVESDVKGLLHTKEETRLRFYVCLYLSIKYFSSIHSPVEFSEVAPNELLTPENLLISEQFETALVVHCLKYDIYRATIYEAADGFCDKLEDTEVRDLIVLYSMNPSIDDITVEELYRYYRSNLKNRSMEEILKPIVREKTVKEEAPKIIITKKQRKPVNKLQNSFNSNLIVPNLNGILVSLNTI